MKHIGRCQLGGVAVFVATCASSALAEMLPLWEVGGGVAAISFPDYRGSASRRSYLLPVPVLVYRGDIFQIDREKMRGLLFKSDRAELDISISGSVPVRSDGNRVREGMPDLDPSLEIGPSLNIWLAKTESAKLALRLPLRAVIASDFRSVHSAGVLANPNLNLDLRAGQGWRVGLVAGALFADRKYHDHFYGVAPAYARPGRSAYRAAGGYSGAQFIAALSRRFEPAWVAGFVKADVLNGAAFASSPLVERRNNVSVGIAVTWVFAQSGTRVERNE
ncbi:MAG: MipA/OmpV family protein [Burkholderiales bacterium]|nr:MipA/OmpV family protein [Burkholderiales bacterium]